VSDRQDSELPQSPKFGDQRLRDLIVLLGALLLQDIALHPPRDRGDANDAAQVLREAELCFRCAKSPGLKQEIAEGLETAGHELMAKAVEIDTIMEREKRKK
jgi:hypothetical protein